MPFGNSSECLSRRDIVRIARRFNAGNTLAAVQVPKGRLKLHSHSHFSRPFGTRIGGDVNPALKRGAIVVCPSGTAAVRRNPNSRKAVQLGRSAVRKGKGHDRNSVTSHWPCELAQCDRAEPVRH